jgi:hypothetical protein
LADLLVLQGVTARCTGRVGCGHVVSMTMPLRVS